MHLKQIDVAMGYALLKPRLPHAHKGTHGTLTVVSGCTLYRGAPYLACEAALRAGVGIVRLASIEQVIAATAANCPEAIYLPLDAQNGAIAPDATAILAAKSSAYLVGCGLPNSTQTLSLTEQMLHGANVPVVLDAGAITSMAQSDGLCFLDKAACPPVLTPHMGEMAALCHTTVDEVAQHADKTAMQFAKAHRCVVVLKSHRTVIATPNGDLYESRLGNAGLAKGGSGDVLAGMIASYLAQGYSQQDAAILGTWLHGMAACTLAQKDTMTAMLPRDLPHAAVQVLRTVPKQGI